MIIDKDLLYDEYRKRYRLTPEYAINRLGTDLQAILYDEFDANSSTLPERTLEYTSNQVYNYMRTNCADFKYACKLIEENQHLLDDFKDVLAYQLISFIQKGDNNLVGDEKIYKISQSAIQVLQGNGLLTIQRHYKLPRNYLYGNGGGIY